MTQQENTLHRGRNLTRRYKKAQRGQNEPKHNKVNINNNVNSKVIRTGD